MISRTVTAVLDAPKEAVFKGPGMPDQLFESQHESLRREFDNIRARFGAAHASCRA